MIVNITQNRDLVTLSIRPQPSLIGKISMFIFNLLGIGLLVLGLYDWILLLLPIGIVWCMFFGWFTLWNCFGRELIQISKSSLGYQLEYGIYQAKAEIREVNKALNISLIPAGEYNNEERYQLIFESFNTKGIPEEIYRTTLSISETDLKELKIAIRQLYFKKVDPDYLKQPFILN